ncbi:hypothetical protein [Oceanospirillum sediminis]|uniref:Uncharacterized protein n=1 Tax=Oceanospirillum sediminis TaxID=2760088 RepID=A0A839IRC9_9GAMM|nr:hypothetical protein [Oceanospirillum sediminis]MBB1487102.1 hypothetical protein [Oceanospirillum sediminis]
MPEYSHSSALTAPLPAPPHTDSVLFSFCRQQKTITRSVLVALEGSATEQLSARWQGSMLWQCNSPVRPRHKRKNCFFSEQAFTVPDSGVAGDEHREIQFRSCPASGAGPACEYNRFSDSETASIRENQCICFAFFIVN